MCRYRAHGMMLSVSRLTLEAAIEGVREVSRTLSEQALDLDRDGLVQLVQRATECSEVITEDCELLAEVHGIRPPADFLAICVGVMNDQVSKNDPDLARLLHAEPCW